MRRDAFTLVEMLAVVAVLALLAGAVTWLTAGQVRRAGGREAVSRFIHADRMARLEARRLGLGCVLRLDLDARSISSLGGDDGCGRNTTMRFNLPANCKMERVWVANGAFPSGLWGGNEGVMSGLRGGDSGFSRSESGENIRKVADFGVADVVFSTAGRSATYAAKLVFASDGGGQAAGDAVWIVFCGITGQATCINDDEEIEKLFATVVAGRADAH